MSLALLIIIVVMVLYLVLAVFCAGHCIGYSKGERDTLERADYYTRREW